MENGMTNGMTRTVRVETLCVLLGVLLLDEPLEPALLVGSALTLSGLVIVNSTGNQYKSPDA